jgi:hypothetical protein
MLLLQSCNKEDPKPPNEEELITTVEVKLSPTGGGIPVTLKFFDADGELGSIAPLFTVSGPLKASTTYAAIIELTNETINPHGDISAEVAEEANDHLFCFDVDGNIDIDYNDEDDNGLPLGLITSWVTGQPGDAVVTISLLHQAGTKTGQCPGVGDTDVEVSFNLTVDN